MVSVRERMCGVYVSKRESYAICMRECDMDAEKDGVRAFVCVCICTGHLIETGRANRGMLYM